MLLTWRAPIFDNMSLSVKLNVAKRAKITLRQLPTTTITGDSMIRKVFGEKLSSSLDNKHHVVLRSSDGTTTKFI